MSPKYLILIFCLLFVGCSLPHDINTGKPILWSEVPDYFFGNSDPDWDFWDDPLRQNIKCPEGEHCLDLTERMGGLEGKIFKTLKPKRGWKGKGCVHGKQIDPSAKEAMYCEFCNKEGHQMWMVYDYDNETWTESSFTFACGTRLDKWTLDHFDFLEGP